MKRALITGITGQDGSYLAELLLGEGVRGHGVRPPLELVQHRAARADLPGSARRELPAAPASTAISTTRSSLKRILRAVRPDEIYNLGAQSHVRVSFDVPEYTASAVGIGTLRLLEAIRESGLEPTAALLPGVVERDVRRRGAAAGRDHAVHPAQPVRLRQGVRAPALPELPRRLRHVHLVRHPVQPRVAAARDPVRHAQDDARGGPHPPRPRDSKLYLGNLEALRDWGFAGDYVEAMWIMLQQEKPDDYVIATGESHTCASCARSRSASSTSTGRSTSRSTRATSGRPRSTTCEGNPAKARKAFGWTPKVTFRQLIQMMVRADEEDVRSSLAGRAPTS